MDEEKVDVAKQYAEALKEIDRQRKNGQYAQEKMVELIAWRIETVEKLRALASQWEASGDATIRQCGHTLRDVANGVIRTPHNMDEILDIAHADDLSDA